MWNILFLIECISGLPQISITWFLLFKEQKKLCGLYVNGGFCLLLSDFLVWLLNWTGLRLLWSVYEIFMRHCPAHVQVTVRRQMLKENSSPLGCTSVRPWALLHTLPVPYSRFWGRKCSVQGLVISAGCRWKGGSLSCGGFVEHLPNASLAPYTLSKGDLISHRSFPSWPCSSPSCSSFPCQPPVHFKQIWHLNFSCGVIE